MSSLPLPQKREDLPAAGRQVPSSPDQREALSMNSNDNLRFLNVGLPDDIAKVQGMGRL